MTTSLPFLDSSDPRLKLTVRHRIRNVFVTQSEVTRHLKEENVNYIPVVTEPSSRVLEAGVNTLQKTLVLKKQAELAAVDEQLARKRLEFNSRAQDLAQRRSELETKQQETRETVTKFEKYVADNEVKRRQVLAEYEAEREQNILKRRRIEDLTEQLKQLRARQQVLKERMAKHKIYEDYLLKTLDYFPSTYLDNGSDASVKSIIRRHRSLTDTKQELLERLARLENQVERGEQQLQSMKKGHSVQILVGIKDLSDLQSELEILKEENKQVEANLKMEQRLSRKKVEEVGTLLMAINNLAEQCYLEAYGPLESMNILTMMDMVKEYILDKACTEKRAKRLLESGSTVTSRTTVIDTQEKGPLRNIHCKTQIKSSINISRKNDMMS